MAKLHTHRPLNTKQYAILHELYTYRIATTELLMTSLHLPSTIHIQKRLERLLEQAYIDRSYDASYKLQGKHARYYLSAKGIDALRQRNALTYDSRVLAVLGRTKHPSERYMDECLGIYRIANRLRARHGSHIRLFTKSELAGFAYFPKLRPSLYIRLQRGQDEQQFFLEYVESNRPTQTVTRHIKRYIAYADSGDWDATGTSLPKVLIVTDTRSLERRLLKLLPYVLDEADDDVLRVFVASQDALLHTLDRIWRDPMDPAENYRLEDIQ